MRMCISAFSSRCSFNAGSTVGLGGFAPEALYGFWAALQAGRWRALRRILRDIQGWLCACLPWTVCYHLLMRGVCWYR
jgi:hypothetical protein